MGGCSCSKAVNNVEEGLEWIKKQAKGGGKCGLFVTGDAVILNTETKESFCFRAIQIKSKDPFLKYKFVKVKSEKAEVKPILPTVAGTYKDKNNTPTKDKPFVAMVYLGT